MEYSTASSTHKSCSPPSPLFFLSTSQHVLDMTPVLLLDKFRNLVFSQPLEILETLGIPSQIGLSCHDATLHEKGFLAQTLVSVFLVDLGLSVVVDVVADGMVAYHPGVHVDSGGLCKRTFSSLSTHQLTIISHVPKKPRLSKKKKKKKKVERNSPREETPSSL